MTMITLTHASGLTIKLSSFGASWRSCTLANLSSPKETMPREILLTCEESQLPKQDMYLGATVGRFANRIANAHYQMGDATYKLSANQNNQHTLHGGTDNFSYRQWKISRQSEDSVTFTLFSADGDQGFNGNLTAQVTYQLTADSVIIDYDADCDQTSICSMTNHAYFNLNGNQQNKDARNQYLYIPSDHYLPIDSDGIPLKKALKKVKNTPFDFNHPKLIAKDFANVKTPVNGYDHDWYLADNGTLKTACILQSFDKKCAMTIRTTHPAIHVYSGNFLHAPFKAFSGIALETGCLANSPNLPQFINDCLITPNQPYQHRSIYQFSSH